MHSFAKRSELIVYAHQRILNIRFGAKDAAGGEAASHKAGASRAETHVVVFSEE